MIPLLPWPIDYDRPIHERIALACLPLLGDWGYSFWNKLPSGSFEPSGFYEAPGVPRNLWVENQKTNCTIMCASLLIVAHPPETFSIAGGQSDWADLNVWAEPPRPWDSALRGVEGKGLSRRVDDFPPGVVCLVQGCKTPNKPSHLFFAVKHPETGVILFLQAATGIGPVWAPAKKPISDNYPGGYGISAWRINE